MTLVTIVRTKWAKCEGGSEGGRWDRTRHIPGWRPRAAWYENDTAVPALTRNDRTGLDNALRNVSPSLSSGPIVSCRGKTFAICTGRIYQSI